MKEFLEKANELLEKGKDAAMKGCKIATEKISALEEETKNRISMAEKEKEADRLFKELGKKAYAQFVGGDGEEDVTALCKEIEKVLAEKTNLEKNVLKLKDLVLCENCKNTIDVTAAFCPYCGYPAEKEKAKEEKKEVKKETKKEKVVKEKVSKAKEVKEEKVEKKETKKQEVKVATIKLEKPKTTKTTKTTKKTKDK